MTPAPAEAIRLTTTAASSKNDTERSEMRESDNGRRAVEVDIVSRNPARI